MGNAKQIAVFERSDSHSSWTIHNWGLTTIPNYAMILSSLERTNHPQHDKQANQPRQYSSIVRVSRLSHAPQPLADYQGKGWGAADSRDFRVLSGRAGECGKHKPAPNQRVEEATQ